MFPQIHSKIQLHLDTKYALIYKSKFVLRWFGTTVNNIVDKYTL